MRYFNNCKTIDEAKTLIRKLSMKFHPDTSGGDTQTEFVEMLQEFRNFKPLNDKFKQANNFDPDKFYNLIKIFDNLKGINISFVGTFIWLTDEVNGAMYEQKEKIKSIKIDGYNSARWARKKRSWYFSPENYKKKSRKRFSLEELKNKYGSHEHKTKGAKQLQS